MLQCFKAKHQEQEAPALNPGRLTSGVDLVPDGSNPYRSALPLTAAIVLSNNAFYPKLLQGSLAGWGTDIKVYLKVPSSIVKYKALRSCLQRHRINKERSMTRVHHQGHKLKKGVKFHSHKVCHLFFWDYMNNSRVRSCHELSSFVKENYRTPASKTLLDLCFTEC